jgi:hypothetical protein
MITLGSVSRSTAAEWFDFLSEDFRGRRTAIRELTHGFPDFVFWIYPDGRLHDAKQSHRSNPPPGFEHIVKDEPDYGGFLRGRVVRHLDHQLIVVYCRPEALATSTPSLIQLLVGLDQMPLPIEDGALVVSDNADIYGTVRDLWNLFNAAEEPEISSANP